MIKVTCFFSARIAIATAAAFFLAAQPAFAQRPGANDPGEKPHVAVFGFLNMTEDDAFDVPAESAGGTLFLSMKMLGLYEVSMPDVMPRALSGDGLARWCAANGIDYAVYGTVTSVGNDQRYSIAVFDNAKKTVSLRRAETGSSVMDIFGISDRLILAALDSLTGRHAGFGSLKFDGGETRSDYSIEIDGVMLGDNMKQAERILTGTHRIRILRGTAGDGEEIANKSVTIVEGKTETIRFATAPENGPARTRTPAASAKDSFSELVPHLESLGGKYTQQTDTDKGFIHKISPFSIGKFEVTYRLWYDVYAWATSPDRGAAGYTFKYPGRAGPQNDPRAEPTKKTGNMPVTSVSWRDCILWCNARSEMEGLEPVYCADSKFSVPLRTIDRKLWSSTDVSSGGIDNPYVNKKANGYRLPTSGEWQLAATCGGIYPFDHASGADAAYGENSGARDIDSDGFVRYTDDVAVHSTGSQSAIDRVGTKAPNRWGLYDMSGNAMEWVFDWYEYRPSDAAKTNYTGPTKAGDSRTVRGGGDSSYRGNDLRLGHTEAYVCTLEDSLIGFRVCRSE